MLSEGSALCKKEAWIACQGEPSSEKCIFSTVLFISRYKVPQNKHSLGSENYNQKFAITPKQKACLLIRTLCRLMIEFCYQ